MNALKQHPLKIEALDINKDRADQIEVIMHDFFTDLGFRTERIDSLECRSRDGFSPFSHNKGGLEAIAFRDQYMASMEGTGFENADKTLDKYEEYDRETFLTEVLKVDKSHEMNESEWEEYDEYRRNDEQSTVLFSTDLMLTSESSLNVRMCVCVKDAPYHRQYDDKIEVDVEFKTLKSLKSQLNKLLKRDDVKCFSDNLTDAY
jgi:hypothetical protein